MSNLYYRFSWQNKVRSGLFLGAMVWFALLSFNCAPVRGKIELERGNCDPVKLLKNNVEYLSGDLKTGVGYHPFVDLFADGYENGCLVTTWKGREHKEGENYVSTVRLMENGVLLDLSNNIARGIPVIHLPTESKLEQIRLLLFVVSRPQSHDAQQLVNICKQMQHPNYQCFAPGNHATCRFYLILYPTDPLNKLNFLRDFNSCRLCATEICNGKDDDCDSKIDNIYNADESLQQACYDGPSDSLIGGVYGIGKCRPGTKLCVGGKWGNCIGQVLPQPERCNGQDDDCDSKIDNGNDICEQGQICLDGKCQLSKCRPGSTPCGEQCVDIASDHQNCGACNKLCAAGERCALGQCVTSCPSQTPTACGFSCVDLRTNRKHCGACGQECPDNMLCFQSQCIVSCPTSAPACGSEHHKTCCSLSCCNNTCVDISSNVRHCGKCDEICSVGHICFEGKCVLSCPASAPECGSGSNRTCCSLHCCNENCVDLQNNPKHCGMCNLQCTKGEICFQGRCQISCPPGSPHCGPPEKAICCPYQCCNEVCVDVKNHRYHCGDCNKPCSPGEICVQGHCILSCPTNSPSCGVAGKEVCCPHSCCNYFCIDTKNHREHCGACNKPCEPGQYCENGVCQFSCPQTQRLCGNQCVNLQINPQHCGACYAACKPEERCDNSTCTLCPSSAPSCGPIGHQVCCIFNCCNDTCVDINNNPKHCGKCAEECKNNHHCDNGKCKSCPGHLHACGTSCCYRHQCCNNSCTDLQFNPFNCGQCGNACQAGQTCCHSVCVNLFTDRFNCGSCGNVCALNHSCSSGQCCPDGQNWCENSCVNLATNLHHCGVCGKFCGGDQICNNANCECPPGKTLCNGFCVDTNRHSQHCGDCNRTCAGGTSCQSGQCLCPADTTLCNGMCIDTLHDPMNCGDCNRDCKGGTTCQFGQCLCPLATTLCNGSCVDTHSNPLHCGVCNNACGNNETCQNSVCSQ